MDWESWLKVAAKPPSQSEENRTSSTESQIRAALAAYEPLHKREYRVYAKGSYANNTNVRLNYDVDIAVEYCGTFFYDLKFDLEDADPSEVGIVPSTGTYGPADFKADVLAAVRSAYGSGAVTQGSIAYRIRENKTTLPADVVPSWEYRRYDSIHQGEPVFHVGSRVFPSGSKHRNNFPKIQQSQGIVKNDATGRRYKRAVRALKKLQTKMVAEGALESELPSYFTECLVYNVTNDAFGHSLYVDDLRAVLAQIFNATLPAGDFDEWTHVHGLMRLFHGNFTRSDAHRMADSAWKHLDFD